MFRESLQMGTDLYQHRSTSVTDVGQGVGNIGTDIGIAPTDMGNPCCQGREYTNCGTEDYQHRSTWVTDVPHAQRSQGGRGRDQHRSTWVTDVGQGGEHRYRHRYRPD